MPETIKTAKEAIALAKRKEIKIIDFRFTDRFGTWQPFSMMAKGFNENYFEEGAGLDTSSICGSQENSASLESFPWN